MTRIIVLVVLVVGSALRAEVAKRILRADQMGENLLKKDGWRELGGGRVEAAGDVLVCDNGKDASAQRGFSQTITLNQTEARPIVASAWSMAEAVGGSRDSEYSLYLDLVYADDQPLWGQIAAFRVGSHDWQKAQVQLFPTKPVRSVTVNLLLRRHTGRASFRDARLWQMQAKGGAAWFDGMPVINKGEPVGGFQVRDVAADSDFVTFDNGEALGLKLEESRKYSGPRRDASFFLVKLSDVSGRDRAVTVVYTVPVKGGGWRWLADARREVVAEAPREYMAASRFLAGSNGMISRYPLAAVANEQQGMAIALDMTRPAVYRLAFSAGSNELYIAFDLGLAKEKNAAEVAFSTFSFDAAEGFRGAVARLYELYPESFRCRTPQQGNWMPFYKISRVEGWEDFGFKFKEGNDETAWDDAHGIITFRYTEPTTWWMRMPAQMPRTMEAARAEAKRLAEKGDRSAQALLTSGYHDETGQLVARLRRDPWCDGAVWSMNSSPNVAGAVTDFKNKWNPEIRERLYGKERKGDLDGEYIDSSEGYVTDELDYRRDHFAAAIAPLMFSTDGHRPAVFRGLIAWEYTRGIAEDVHEMGKLMMANGTPDRLCWLAPWLDVMGTETDWNPGGRWRPMSDEQLLYRRVICGPKPYCFLMNTRFEQFPHELVEKYMKRCVAYGMFPGFFSHNASQGHYFSQPALYNRDRDLFKKYVPLCKLVAAAGWRPITGARSSDAKVYVERFGEKYLTVFNDSAERKKATITIRGGAISRCRNLLDGRAIDLREGRMEIELQAEDVAVLELQ